MSNKFQLIIPLIGAVFYFFVVPQVVSAQVKSWQTVIYASDTWRYFEGSSPVPASWAQLSFNDTAWKTGKGGFGYADEDDQTIISEAVSVFIRKKFTLLETASIEAMMLNMDYDDGFIAYLNGVEIARNGITGTNPPYNTLATINHEATMYTGGKPESFTILKSLFQSILKTGENVLAIQVHNNSVSSSDLSAIAFLSLGLNHTNPIYGTPPAWFSAPSLVFSSNIPLLMIETENGKTITDEPKTKAYLRMVNNGAGNRNNVDDFPNEYSGSIGIEVRGRYSSSLPQKPYGFETRDPSGENYNVKLLGMPKENDWILLANYNDKSFMRNSLVFHWFEKMGHYAPRTRACEVIINSNYQGIYILTEKIKQDKNRVDIAGIDADDNAGDSLTGGYIFKIDYTDEGSWTGTYPPIDRLGVQVNFVYHDPKTEELTNDQKLYLKNFVHSFETVLRSPGYNHPEKGYRAYIDVQSFIDYILLGEVSRNVDAYKKSRYFSKERDNRGGLLSSGPVWDMDWSMKNIWDCDFLSQTDGSGWAYKINDCNVWPAPPGWEVRLMQDPLFANQLYTRYTDLRKSILSNSYIEKYADSVKNHLMEAQARHYQTWDILGKNVGASEKDAIPTTYEGEVNKLVNWLKLRLAWLDKNIKGTYINNSVLYTAENFVRIFPNPAVAQVVVESDKIITGILIFDTQGRVIRKLSNLSDYSVPIEITGFPSGIYLISIERKNQQKMVSRFVVSK